MKKLLLTLCVLCLLLVIGTLFILPYGLGIAAKNKYTQLLSVDEFTKSSNGFQITLMDYQRGWFSSEATLKITLPSNIAQKTHIDALTVQEHIEHGPVFTLSTHTGEKHIALGQALIATHLDSILGAIDVVSQIKLDGVVVGTFNAPTLHYADTNESGDDNEKTMVAMDQLSGTFTISADLKKIDHDVRVQKMTLQRGALTQQINQTHVSYHLIKSASGLFLGNRTFAIDSIDFSAGSIAEKPVRLQGFKVDIDDEEKNHQLNSNISGTIQYVTANNANYGPQELALTIQHIDIPTLLAAKKALNRLYQNAASLQEVFKQYQLLSAELLSHGVELNVSKMQLVTPWGNPSLVARFTVPNKPTQDMAQLMQITSFTADANIPATFLLRILESMQSLLPTTAVNSTVIKNAAVNNEIPALADTKVDSKKPPLSPVQRAQQIVTDWVGKQWLLPKGNGYQVLVEYQNQQMTVNGKQLPDAPPSPAASENTNNNDAAIQQSNISSSELM